MPSDEKNPFLALISTPQVLIVLVGIVYGYSTLNSRVGQNTEEIRRLTQSVEKELIEVNQSLSEQSDRFELYLDSLRSVRSDTEGQIEENTARIDVIERKLILLEKQ